MVVQKVIKLEEPYCLVRGRRNRTYQAVIRKGLSTVKILGGLSQGWNVECNVEWQHDVPTITTFYLNKPEPVKTVAQEALEVKAWANMGNDY
jgi:hypothetical protein